MLQKPLKSYDKLVFNDLTHTRLSPNKIINVWINKLFVYKIMIKAVCTNNYLLIRTNLLEVTFLSPQEWIEGKKTRQNLQNTRYPNVYSE